MPIDADGNLIPDFGDARTTTLAVDGRPASSAAAGPRKMVFICSKGNLDMAYPALIMGNAALGEGIEVEYFFTFWGLDIVDLRTMDSLKFSFGGNTAMHMPQLERLKGGLGAVSIPQGLAALPGVTTASTAMMKKMMAGMDIPSVPEMIDHVVAMGAKLWACQLSVDMMQLKKANLHPGVLAVISAADFIEKSEGAQIVFI
ncbi:MAG: DsrE/DsrF/DrsH-like family protein [Tessaracoccus sp.]|uniref:DsrE/DsrF/DrsH-like family protein n=1 Tax=Tessaracoccus sp. TaxID=1971211 RepID=UPI001ECC768E|nr:DsrE/DsrF/DrsH-like family protein [Tessaracoccus sp.]MBK7822382.1 DsrE/DsrF/DrsH-like family protein [Tessaracoccus sp.]